MSYEPNYFNNHNEKNNQKSITMKNNAPLFYDTRTLKLSLLLKKIREKITQIRIDDGLSIIELEKLNGKIMTIRKNISDVFAYFDSQHFNSNYSFAFGKSFDSAKLKYLQIPNMKIIIDYDVKNNGEKSIKIDEILDFRFMTCFSFSFLFNIEIDDCICYPTSNIDWIAYNSGIAKNCLSQECRELLNNRPDLYDPLVHSDCSNILETSFIFNLLKVHNNGNVNIEINDF